MKQSPNGVRCNTSLFATRRLRRRAITRIVDRAATRPDRDRTGLVAPLSCRRSGRPSPLREPGLRDREPDPGRASTRFSRRSAIRCGRRRHRHHRSRISTAGRFGTVRSNRDPAMHASDVSAGVAVITERGDESAIVIERNAFRHTGTSRRRRIRIPVLHAVPRRGPPHHRARRRLAWHSPYGRVRAEGRATTISPPRRRPRGTRAGRA